MKVKEMTISAVLSAISLAIFVLESQIPPLFPIPGLKLGLANVVTLFALTILGTRSAIFVLAIKICLGNLFAGSWVSFIYSLFGGVFCIGVEILMLKKLSKEQIWAISITGAIFHNIGQIFAAVILLGTEKIAWYLVILIPVAIITGAFTGICAKYLLLAIQKFKI